MPLVDMAGQDGLGLGGVCAISAPERTRCVMLLQVVGQLLSTAGCEGAEGACQLRINGRGGIAVVGFEVVPQFCPTH